MPDLESAQRLLAAASRDLHAIGNMLDPNRFPDEVFGFLAQQAMKKNLKAWLALRGKEIPRTHNLRFLIILLEQAGAPVPQEWKLLDLTAFAVQFRYESCEPMDACLDRATILKQITDLFSWTTTLLSSTEPQD
ncbi:MAG: HEPN domain-containing protein [Magnetococcales bacterium]|nr:HEPN domain-containing protein [Magnetococcales bacterium]